MRHIKTFESFSINESNDDVHSFVEAELAKKSPEEMEMIMADVQRLSEELGLSLEEMQDEETMMKILGEETEGKLPESEASEGLSDAWEWTKRQASKVVRVMSNIIGIGGPLAGVLSMITGIVCGSEDRGNWFAKIADMARHATGISETAGRAEQAALFGIGVGAIVISIVAAHLLSKGADRLRR